MEIAMSGKFAHPWAPAELLFCTTRALRTAHRVLQAALDLKHALQLASASSPAHEFQGAAWNEKVISLFP